MFGKRKNDTEAAPDTTVPATGYAYCESVHATPMSPHHIRKLTAAGMKSGGGADTAALCGRDLRAGWDTSPVKADDDVMALSEPRASNDMRDASWRACRPCALAYLETTGADTGEGSTDHPNP
jgi:hypothetical protein